MCRHFCVSNYTPKLNSSQSILMMLIFPSIFMAFKVTTTVLKCVKYTLTIYEKEACVKWLILFHSY